MRLQQVKITPDPYEPFLLAQAHRVGDLLFVSGQAGIGADGRIVGIGDFEQQAEQAFLNLDRVLRAGGSSLPNVVKVTIFVTDMANFDKVVELRRRWFTTPYPADTIAEVSSLYSPDALFEIEAIAVVDDVVERVELASVGVSSGTESRDETSSAQSNLPAGTVPPGRRPALASRVRQALRSAMSEAAYLKPVVPPLLDYPYPVTRGGK